MSDMYKNDDDNFTEIPNKKYQDFFNKFSEISSLKIEEWKVPHLIGYWCQRYQKHYNKKYQFKFNSPAPSRCFEVFQIKKLSSILSSKPNILKDYIDYLFEKKIIQAKRRITSISFLTNEEYMKEYKLNVLFATPTITRTTPLPDKYIAILIEAGRITDTTYGDLAFLYQAKDSIDDIKILGALSKIENLGFDFSILDKVI